MERTKAATTAGVDSVPVAAQPAESPPLPATDVASAPIADPAAPARAGTSVESEDALIVGGGALALLALGGAGVAATRRRRREKDEFGEEYEPTLDLSPEMAVDEPVVAAPVADPVPARTQPVRWADPAFAPQPALVMPSASAFSWGNAPRTPEHRPDESWTERAHRGPTPDNPSLSLKKRLKRAAFFDQREREAAAGRAEPVAADAGLPDAVMPEQHKREAEFA